MRRDIRLGLLLRIANDSMDVCLVSVTSFFVLYFVFFVISIVERSTHPTGTRSRSYIIIYKCVMTEKYDRVHFLLHTLMSR